MPGQDGICLDGARYRREKGGVRLEQAPDLEEIRIPELVCGEPVRWAAAYAFARTAAVRVCLPGSMEQIGKMIDENNVNVKYILLTHCHYDHIMSVIPLKEKTGARIVTGDKGSINLGDPDINLTPYGLGYKIEGISSDIVLKDGESLELDGLSIKCIYTPGHTNCGVCYLCGNDLFCGDTLFLRSCGRWDLPTGNQHVLRYRHHHELPLVF